MNTLTYRLNRISITDFKKIKSLDLDLSNTLTIIGGKNAQGKSSTIDAIVSAIAGAKHSPRVPIRKGADKATVVLSVEGPNGIVELVETFTATGRKVELRNADGFRSESPQKLLDTWFSATSIDPLNFIRLEGKKQVELLKKVFGLDFTELDFRRKSLYDERTGKNAVWQSLKGTYEQMERESANEPADTPDEEVAVSELTAQLSKILEHNEFGKKLAAESAQAADNLATADSWIENQEKVVANLRDQLAEAEKTLTSYNEKRGGIEKKAIEAKALASAFEPKDPAPIQSQIEGADRINGFVRQKARRVEHRQKFAQARKEADALTERIKAIDEDKAKQLAAVKMPVEGLTFDEDGLYLNGLPIEQASSAEQLRVSIPVSFAADTSLKFAIIRDGSLLDEDSLKLVAELTEAAGGQTIIEKVSTHAEECSVILEDGEAKEVAA